MHYILRCCFVFLFVCLTGFLYAQELRYSFKNYTPSDGLPSSETYQVLRDASNYMWFATDHGVCRYNGYEFEKFNLPDNSVMGLYEDGKKRVWAFTFSGRLFYYQNGKFHDYKWNNKLASAIKPGIIHSIYIDSSDQLYLMSWGPYYITINDQGILKEQNEMMASAILDAFETKRPDFFVGILAYPERFLKGGLPSNDSTVLKISYEDKHLSVTIPYLIQHERCRLKYLSDGRFILYTKDCYVIIRSSTDYTLVKTPYTVDDVEEVNGNIFLATGQGLQVLNSRGR